MDTINTNDNLENNNISLFYIFFNFQLKKYFFSSITYILIFLFPLVITFFSITILENYLIIQILIPGSLMVSTFFIFGIYFLNIYNDKLFDIFKIEDKRYIMFLSTFCLVVISNLIISFFSIFLVLFFSLIIDLNIIFDSFYSYFDISFTILNARWFIFFYSFALQTIILFLFAILFFNLTKAKFSNFIVLVSIFSLSALFFGGLLSNDYFNFLSYLNEFPVDGEFIVNNDDYLLNQDTLFINIGIKEHGLKFGEVLPHFFPTYHINQFQRYIFSDIFLINDQDNSWLINGVEATVPEIKIYIKYFNFSSFSSFLIIFTPYLWMIFLFLINLYFKI